MTWQARLEMHPEAIGSASGQVRLTAELVAVFQSPTFGVFDIESQVCEASRHHSLSFFVRSHKLAQVKALVWVRRKLRP